MAGTDDHDGAESVITMRRNQRSRWCGIRNLAGARLLMPDPDTTGGLVVLDATGHLHAVYRHVVERFELIAPDDPTMRFDAVTLHVAKTHRGTGKNAVVTKEKAAGIAKETLTDLRRALGAEASDRSVLVVTHADYAEAAWYQLVGAPVPRTPEEAMDTVLTPATVSGLPFARFAVAHWNRLDGENVWRDFDVLVIPTLLYGDPSTDRNVTNAVRGYAMSDAELNDPPAVVREVREARILAAVLQAVGRTRMRNADTQGHAPAVDVFLYVPSARKMIDHAHVVTGLQRSLPGLVVRAWSAGTRDMFRTRGPQAMDRAYGPGWVAQGPGPIQRPEGTPLWTWLRVLKSAKSIGSPLHRRLTEAGLRVESRRGGSGRNRGGVWLRSISEDAPSPRAQTPRLHRPQTCSSA
jgi:hypothetical protein